MQTTNPYEEISSRIEELCNQSYQRIFTLATGTLALSVTFRSSLISETSTSLWALKLSWVALLISVLSGVLTPLVEALVWAKIVATKSDRLTARHKALVGIAAAITTASFMSGMIFFATYALLNIK